ETERVDRWRDTFVEAELVERDVVAAEVGLEDGQIPLERRHGRGRSSQVRERGIAAPDPEDEPAGRRGLEGHGGGGRDGGVARHGVGDRGAEADALRLPGREGEADPGIAGEVLRVDDGEAVESRRLRPRRRPLHHARPRDPGRPDLGQQRSSLGASAPCAPYFRTSLLAGSSGNGTVRNHRHSTTSYTLLIAPARKNGSPNAMDWLTPASAGPTGRTT